MPEDPRTFSDVICMIVEVIDPLLALIAALALLAFFWGMAKFLGNTADEKARNDGKNLIVWGIIILFVMFSIWGILHFLTTDIFGEGLAFPFLPGDSPSCQI